MINKAQVQRLYEEEIDKAIKAGLPIPTEYLDKNIGFMKATSKLGDCKYRTWTTGQKYDIHIRITTYLQEATEQNIRETIAHELCHTCPGDGHGKEWKHWASILNHTYGYSISRVASESECATIPKPPKVHIVRCTHCGLEYTRSRHSNLTLHPENYRCGKCHGKLELIK